MANPQVLPWRNGVIAAYFASGLVISTLVARLPSVRDALGLSHGEVGLLLLCMTAGSFLSVSASGFIVLRLGSKRTMIAGATIASLGMALVGASAAGLGSIPLTGLALALQGLGTASWNVASNVQGAAMERALRKGIMPALHGFFSVGTVVGAAAGAAGAALHISIGWHFGLMALIVVSLVYGGSRTFQPEATVTGTGHSNKSLLAAAWREPRTLVLGLLVLGMALAEGAAGDWVALALSDGYGSANTVGAIGYGIFVSAMTVARMLGGRILDRFGRVLVMRVSAASALAGLLLFVYGPSVEVAMLALVLWGLGVALSFPIAMTAASDDPMRAAARVSVVSTIGYGAFLGGPPLLGLLADRIGLLNALATVGVLIVMSFVLASATAPVTKNAAQPAAEKTP
ncbi:sugar MFS transporter [Arthrobacter sp. MYb227]|uniref:MFS transporter n=1 Tax=Arthrobacter sp. MYb227 TaxID=1848601 RepID=UPI002157B32A|nr:MFS transporter [Arthrobacter sp. MYb227]